MPPPSTAGGSLGDGQDVHPGTGSKTRTGGRGEPHPHLYTLQQVPTLCNLRSLEDERYPKLMIRHFILNNV